MKQLKVKIIIAGEPGAGKSFIAQATDVCCASKEIGASIGKVIESFEDSSWEMTLMTWTINRGRPRESTHIENTEAAIIVCDITKPETIDETSKWAETVIKFGGEIPLFFVANNADLGTADSINRLEITARNFDSHCYPIQSEDRESVRELFSAIAKLLWEDFVRKKVNAFLSQWKGDDKVKDEIFRIVTAWKEEN